LRWEHSILVIEVADTSLLHDLNRKLPLYAKSGVPEVWIEDVQGEVILVFRDPGVNGYNTSLVVGHGDSIAIAAFPEVPFEVNDLIGPGPQQLQAKS
jgi:Uma2 family endonuclease